MRKKLWRLMLSFEYILPGIYFPNIVNVLTQLVIVSVYFPLNAQLSLIKDLEASQKNSNSNPRNLTHGDDIFYFTAYTPSTGTELWISDGTPQGTKILKDIYKGTNSSNPENLIFVKGTLYFTVKLPDGEKQLWKSNGTEEKTTFVKEIIPRTLSENRNKKESIITDFTKAGDRIFFRVGDSQGVDFLWTSDGTMEGTSNVCEINENINFQIENNGSYNFTAIGKTLFWSAKNTGKLNIWKSDGSIHGTKIIKEFNVLSNPYNNDLEEKLRDFTVVNHKLYFVFSNYSQDQLWSIDTLNEAIERIYPLEDQPKWFTIHGLCEYNNKLYFKFATDSLNIFWENAYLSCLEDDKRIKLICRIEAHWDKKLMENGIIRVINDSLFFSDYYNDTTLIWKSDGTAVGTSNFLKVKGKTEFLNQIGELVLLRNISNQTCFLLLEGLTNKIFLQEDIQSQEWNDESEFHRVVFNRSLFFGYTHKEMGAELSNLGRRGISLVKDINTCTDSSFPKYFQKSKNKVYFYAQNGIWVSDGTTAGTKLIHTQRTAYPTLTFANEKVFFFDRDEELRTQLLIYDGRNLKKLPVLGNQCSCSAEFYPLGSLKGKFYFFCLNKENGFFGESNGTLSGTEMIRKESFSQVDGEINSFYHFKSHIVSNRLIVRFHLGTELKAWKIGSTFPFVKPLRFFRELPTSEFKTLERYTYVFSKSSLWKTNGKKSGTKKLITMEHIDKPAFLAHDKHLLFHFKNYLYNTELWKFDVLTGAFFKIFEFSDEISNRNIYESCVLNGETFFLLQVSDSDNYFELWKTDGTSAGTLRIKRINSSFFPYSGLRVYKGKLFFIGQEKFDDVLRLWVSDGTEVGTKVLENVVFTQNGGADVNFEVLADGLIFSCENFEVGDELWRYKVE